MSIVNVYKKDRIAYVKMNRPEKLNALSIELIEGLIDAFQEADRDEDVNVILLSGEGKSFCAGGDISSFQQLKNTAEITFWMKRATKLEETIRNLDKYVISAVHGYAAGAGFSLALATDMVVAHKDAAFSFSFSNIGLIPDLGLVKNLVKNVSLPVAKEWISTGATISAKEAESKGLVNRIAEGDVLEEATRFAQRIVNGPPLANKFVKYLVNNASDMGNESNLMQEITIQALLLQSEDCQEGVKAFFEKRKPVFSGK
ncbi:enoyl-CoA hydratase/isomerase family protein [Fervidibacillus halotolerans]|uniref:Enoyl-CoA hydratase/isomerase family protein n=1 Tax=Fervidibacillus halotolerans TaxID=2980027 RepID=A0A9E8LYG1_9BACI|nr:enoyl-CoA hydratase/isomerase family protein [Fervidibacillus halotolerans]WAA12068.1 enoyl-CoA hydratase/isomerase family protein [Fervidibacillus halotolerans]